MFMDNYVNVEEYKVLVFNYRNEENFVSMDLTQSQAINYFIRPQFIENVGDSSESWYTTTIKRITEDEVKFVPGSSNVDITLRLDSY